MGFIDDLAARLKQPLPGPEAQLKMAPAFAKASAGLTPASARITPASAGLTPASARITPASARPMLNDAPADVKHAAALILLFPESRPGLQSRRDAGADAPAYDRFSIPLTIRRPDLLHHPGQISLPGGGIDHGEMAEAAALREAEEEIGVDPASVRILGPLTPLYVIVSGFVVTPFVGVVGSRPAFRPETREVAEILEVPLSDLRDPSRRLWGKRTREGYLIDFPYFSVEDVAHRGPGDGGQPHQVWGATAMMLSEFVELF